MMGRLPSFGLRGALTAISTVSFLALAACGGGGSGGGVISTPAPTPAPSPTPAPAPAPSPTPTATNFNTQEYRDSDGKAQHNAIYAWQEGYSGDGVAIGIVDTGIDVDNPQFAGRISAASADVAGSRGVNDVDGHGTNVAIVAAAARDNSGVMGMAYEATIIALRADEPGSCAAADPSDPSSGCSFFDSDIARGVDAAVAAGARVVNLSLGGSAPTQQLRDAVARAGEAGVVVVVSAGNDGASTDPQIDPDNPDPFASGLRAAAPENVIIVGSVDANDTISSFSNRAGSDAQFYITARGEDVCCVYDNGEIYTEVSGGAEYVYVLYGTSFSAPQVAGAAALLAQAFPNLTGAEIVDLILLGARDAGAAGVDPVYGHGVLDIERSFAPQGTTSLAGTGIAVSLGEGTGVTSAAMGDAVARASIGTVITDKYDRAYGLDLASGLSRARVEPKLYGAVNGRTQGLEIEAGSASLAFTVDPGAVRAAAPVPLRLDTENVDRARLLAARLGARIAPGTQFAFALREGARGLEAGLAGQSRPAFLVAGEAGNDMGFVARRDGAVAVRQAFGDFGLTVSGESGKVWTDPLGGQTRLQGETGDFTRYTARFDWSGNALALSAAASWLAEEETMLGARLADNFGAGGADSVFLDATASIRPARGWSLSADYRHGFTSADAMGLVAEGSKFQSSAWSVDVERRGVFAGADGLGFRVSQPLRVESGGLGLKLPVGYDYASETASFGVRELSLAPSGRERIAELRWFGPLAGGNVTASLFFRTDPGHVAALPDDKGGAIRWFAKF
ncbi:S8 family peptidase [Croceicoccus bisphenolivorans]|uniref:S8 family peptidase n=1 Tax=Croceicoccus bisphenolivorans TaxID=1783232 RepID=UPI000A86AD86|nr:S8 family peptidase [Croceicoccus bisphenolivorans]